MVSATSRSSFLADKIKLGRKMLPTVLVFIFISALIYLGIAGVLIVSGKPDRLVQAEKGIEFKELFGDYDALPALQSFQARDGADLFYRYYPSVSDQVLIILHGSGYHSKYLMPLAKFISAEGLAHVYTPDLRGHGPSPARRGDVDYIEQLEDDIADLIAIVRAKQPAARLIVGGHSSGGGLAIRFAGSQYGRQAEAFLLLSPFLQYNAPTVRPHSGGWAQPNTQRIAGLVMLNNAGIRWFNHLTVIQFNMPAQARDGTETLAYTYRLNAAFAPRDYAKDLRAIKQPLLVVAGTADEAFYASQFEPVFAQYTTARVELLDGVTHMGIVGNKIQPVIKDWLQGLE